MSTFALLLCGCQNGYRMSVILNGNNRLQLPQDVRPQIGDEQYCGLQPYIDSAKAFARIT